MRSLWLILLQVILMGYAPVSVAENPKESIQEILANPEYQQNLPDWKGNLELPAAELMEQLEALPLPDLEPLSSEEESSIFSFLKGCVDTSSSEGKAEPPPINGEPRKPSKLNTQKDSSFMQGCSPPSGNRTELSEGEGSDNQTPSALTPNQANPKQTASAPASREQQPPNLELSSFLKLLTSFIIILILAALLFRFFRDNSKPQLIQPARSSYPSKKEQLEAPPKTDLQLISSEELASQARYSEAIHVLLLHAVTLLKKHVPQSDFLTAREINRKARINGKAKRAFATLLSTAELAHFGERKLGWEEYQACAKHYQIFTQNL